MIGHAMPAAGMAGLIKTALALYHRVLPPTLHADKPHPLLDQPESPFASNPSARPWIHADPDTPRRAGVNAFGFAGINAHAVLEEHAASADGDRARRPATLGDRGDPPLRPRSRRLDRAGPRACSTGSRRNPRDTLQDLAYYAQQRSANIRPAARVWAWSRLRLPSWPSA